MHGQQNIELHIFKVFITADLIRISWHKLAPCTNSKSRRGL